jgi:type II secretory pathway component GspD/PulD (secretin)
MWVQVPAGFCEESGLTVDNPMPKTGELLTFLSRREMKMLGALVQAYPGRRILATPRLTMVDGQTGSIQTTGPVEEVASLVPITTDGKTVYTPQTLSLISSHLTFKVTPKISKDNGMVEVRVDRETANLGEGVTLGTNTIAPSVNILTQETKVVLPDGGSVAIVNKIASTRDKTQKTETLWVLTAHVVKGKP